MSTVSNEDFVLVFKLFSYYYVSINLKAYTLPEEMGDSDSYRNW